MSLKPQIHILAASMINVILVQHIIQTLIEVFKIEQNNSASGLHANLDLIDVTTNLDRIQIIMDVSRGIPLDTFY